MKKPRTGSDTRQKIKNTFSSSQEKGKEEKSENKMHILHPFGKKKKTLYLLYVDILQDSNFED